MLLDIIDDEPLVQVSGEVDASNAEDLARALEVKGRHGGVVALDLGGVSFLDGSGAHVLIDVAGRMRGRGRLLLCRPSEPVRRVLEALDAVRLEGLEVLPDSAWDVMRRLFVGLAKADPHAMQELVAADAVWHVPGRNRFSGVYRGLEEILRMASQMKEHTAEYIREIEDVAWGEDNVAVLANLWGDRNGKVLYGAREAVIFRLEGGLVVEGWSYLFDPAELDGFWS